MSHVHQINVSNGGVPKRPIDRAWIGTDGVEGDYQADRKHHGGPDQTLCLFSLEVIEMLQGEGHPIAPGSAGENLTISGLDWAAMAAGQRFRVGDDLVMEVTDTATPCSKNAQWFVDGNFRRMSDSAYRGSSRWYAKVVSPGIVANLDPVVLLNP
jgi:MOSC domain-containing protein YiiM